ncbi:hypothetical protein GF324_13050 [bacterium]|nr:hypothetical protein [bacterium]
MRLYRKHDWRQQIEDETRKKSSTVVEQTGTAAVKRDKEHKHQSGRHPQKDREKARLKHGTAAPDKESSDLRLRREEDDYGKGEHLDVKG